MSIFHMKFKKFRKKFLLKTSCYPDFDFDFFRYIFPLFQKLTHDIIKIALFSIFDHIYDVNNIILSQSYTYIEFGK